MMACFSAGVLASDALEALGRGVLTIARGMLGHGRADMTSSQMRLVDAHGKRPPDAGASWKGSRPSASVGFTVEVVPVRSKAASVDVRGSSGRAASMAKASSLRARVLQYLCGFRRRRPACRRASGCGSRRSSLTHCTTRRTRTRAPAGWSPSTDGIEMVSMSSVSFATTRGWRGGTAPRNVISRARTALPIKSGGLVHPSLSLTMPCRGRSARTG